MIYLYVFLNKTSHDKGGACANK